MLLVRVINSGAVISRIKNPIIIRVGGISYRTHIPSTHTAVGQEKSRLT